MGTLIQIHAEADFVSIFNYLPGRTVNVWTKFAENQVFRPIYYSIWDKTKLILNVVLINSSILQSYFKRES